MVDYADIDTLIADYLPEVKAAPQLAALGRILTSVTRFIDTYCSRPAQHFAPQESNSAAELRYLRGESKRYLRLPAHIGAVVLVTEAESRIELTGTFERDSRLFRATIPGAYLGGMSPWIWRQDTQFGITARWGYAQTPEDITEATRQLVVHFFERQRGTIGQVTPTGFLIEKDMPPPVKMMLEPYRLRDFQVQ